MPRTKRTARRRPYSQRRILEWVGCSDATTFLQPSDKWWKVLFAEQFWDEKNERREVKFSVIWKKYILPELRFAWLCTNTERSKTCRAVRNLIADYLRVELPRNIKLVWDYHNCTDEVVDEDSDEEEIEGDFVVPKSLRHTKRKPVVTRPKMLARKSSCSPVRLPIPSQIKSPSPAAPISIKIVDLTLDEPLSTLIPTQLCQSPNIPTSPITLKPIESVIQFGNIKVNSTDKCASCSVSLHRDALFCHCCGSQTECNPIRKLEEKLRDKVDKYTDTGDDPDKKVLNDLFAVDAMKIKGPALVLDGKLCGTTRILRDAGFQYEIVIPNNTMSYFDIKKWSGLCTAIPLTIQDIPNYSNIFKLPDFGSIYLDFTGTVEQLKGCEYLLQSQILKLFVITICKRVADSVERAIDWVKKNCPRPFELEVNRAHRHMHVLFFRIK